MTDISPNHWFRKSLSNKTYIQKENFPIERENFKFSLSWPFLQLRLRDIIQSPSIICTNPIFGIMCW